MQGGWSSSHEIVHLSRILNQCCRLNHFVFSRGVEPTSKGGKNAGLGKVSFSPYTINQFLSWSWAAVKHIVFYRAEKMPPPTQPWRKYLGCWKVARLVLMMTENISPFKSWVLSSKRLVLMKMIENICAIAFKGRFLFSIHKGLPGFAGKGAEKDCSKERISCGSFEEGFYIF